MVSDEKLLSYLLNENHPEQPGHAILFRELLGVGRDQVVELRAALLEAAAEGDATPGRFSPHGSKYEIRFEMTGPRGTYTILSVWIIEHGSDRPHLVTAFIE